jgi:hypothetical protein
MAWQEACEGEKGGFDAAYTTGGRERAACGGRSGRDFFRERRTRGMVVRGRAEGGRRADARTERRKVDQIFVSTPFFLGVEMIVVNFLIVNL